MGDWTGSAKPEDRLRLRLNWATFALAGLLAFVLIAPWFVHQYIAHGAMLFDTILREHAILAGRRPGLRR